MQCIFVVLKYLFANYKDRNIKNKIINIRIFIFKYILNNYQKTVIINTDIFKRISHKLYSIVKICPLFQVILK